MACASPPSCRTQAHLTGCTGYGPSTSRTTLSRPLDEWKSLGHELREPVSMAFCKSLGHELQLVGVAGQRVHRLAGLDLARAAIDELGLARPIAE